jgi:hypothetical protein
LVIGVTAGVSVGKRGVPLRASGQISAGIVVNRKNARLYFSGGGEVSVKPKGTDGVSEIAGVTLGHIDGETEDLGGDSTSKGGTIGDGVAVSGERTSGKSADGTRRVRGTMVTVGEGGGVSIHGGASKTTVSPTTDEMWDNMNRSIPEMFKSWIGMK